MLDGPVAQPGRAAGSNPGGPATPIKGSTIFLHPIEKRYYSNQSDIVPTNFIEIL